MSACTTNHQNGKNNLNDVSEMSGHLQHAVTLVTVSVTSAVAVVVAVCRATSRCRTLRLVFQLHHHLVVHWSWLLQLCTLWFTQTFYTVNQRLWVVVTYHSTTSFV